MTHQHDDACYHAWHRAGKSVTVLTEIIILLLLQFDEAELEHRIPLVLQHGFHVNELEAELFLDLGVGEVRPGHVGTANMHRQLYFTTVCIYISLICGFLAVPNTLHGHTRTPTLS